MVDKVKPLKYENSVDGTQNDVSPTETKPSEDYLAAKGIAFENSNDRLIDLDASGDLRFKDASNPSGKTLKSIQQDVSDKYPSSNPSGFETPSQLNSRDTANRSRANHTGSQAISTVTNLQNSLDAKYDASNPSGFETPSQLNARDTANRSRANHTGTQLAATISDFAATALATLLTGISFATGTPIVATDSFLIAFGKIQKQISDNVTAIGLKYDASNPNGYETPSQLNSRDTANRGRANHTGTQTKSTISDFAHASSHLSTGNDPIANATTSQDGLMSPTDKTKLNGIATGATANSSDATLLARANHTGAQLASTISDLASAVLAVVLSGLSLATSTAVVSTDSILVAIGKLQAQVTLRALSSRSVSAGTGLTGGGDLTADRTISMPNTGTAGTYGAADKYNAITTDTQGRVTAIVPTLISIVASQVSDFAAEVRAVVLTGISFATSTDVVATDTILAAIGKLQAILNAIRTSVAPVATGVANAIGSSLSFAKADHVHDTRLTRYRVTSQTLFQTTSTTFVIITGMSITPTVAGTYALEYDIVINPSSNSAIARSVIYKNGAQVADSESVNTGRASAYDQLSGGTELAMNGTTDSIELRVNTSAGTLSIYNRRLKITRITN